MRLALLIGMLVAGGADDPSLWLEEIEGERALAWAKSQDERTHRELASYPEFEPLHRQALEVLHPQPRRDLRYAPLFVYRSLRDDRVHSGDERQTAARLQEFGEPVWYFETIEGVQDGSSTNEQHANRLARSSTPLWRHRGEPPVSRMDVGASASAAQPTGRTPRPFKERVHTIPGTIEAEDFDEGGEGVSYHDVDSENQEKKGPAYRESGVDLEWRPAASGRYNLGWTRAGEWLVYSVDVRETANYRLEMMVACDGPGGTFHVEVDGVDRTGRIAIPDTGGWEHLKPLVRGGVRLEAGRRTMRVVMDTEGKSGSTGDIDFFRFVKQ